MTYDMNPVSTPASRTSPLGLPVLALVGLAALGLPRVILHDLHLVDPGGPITWLLVFLPIAVWIAVAVVRRVPKPFLTVFVIGVMYGVMLVITHQLLWLPAYSGTPPVLGGDGAVGAILPRIAAIPGGLFVGAAVGAIGGLIAWGIRSIAKRSGGVA